MQAVSQSVSQKSQTIYYMYINVSSVIAWRATDVICTRGALEKECVCVCVCER